MWSQLTISIFKMSFEGRHWKALKRDCVSQKKTKTTLFALERYMAKIPSFKPKTRQNEINFVADASRLLQKIQLAFVQGKGHICTLCKGQHALQILNLNMPHLYLINSSQEDSSSCYSINPAGLSSKHMYSYILLFGEIYTSLSPAFSFKAVFLMIVGGMKKYHHVGLMQDSQGYLSNLSPPQSFM